MDGLGLVSQSLGLALCGTSQHNKPSSSHPDADLQARGGPSGTTSTLMLGLCLIRTSSNIKKWKSNVPNVYTGRRSEKLISYKYGDNWAHFQRFIVFHSVVHMKSDRNGEMKGFFLHCQSLHEVHVGLLDL